MVPQHADLFSPEQNSVKVTRSSVKLCVTTWNKLYKLRVGCCEWLDYSEVTSDWPYVWQNAEPRCTATKRMIGSDMHCGGVHLSTGSCAGISSR